MPTITGKKRKAVCSYALSEDIRRSQILQMASFTMVGKIIGKNVSITVIENGIKDEWAEELGEVPELEGLTREWFALNFAQQAHVNWVLARNWSLEQCPVLVKMWNPTFDASHEQVDVIPIWVHLPSLPRKYWSEEHFISIGNILGTFLEADMSFKVTKLRRVARILVNINVREGLYEEIHLSWGNNLFKQ